MATKGFLTPPEAEAGVTWGLGAPETQEQPSCHRPWSVGCGTLCFPPCAGQ